MGEPKFNPILDGFNRSIGNLTFYSRDGKTFTRRRSGPTGDPTASQSVVRKSFLLAAADWRTLPSIIKKSWREAAPYRRGYNRFIGINSVRYKNHDPIRLSEPLGMESQVTVTAVPGASGAIDLSFGIPEGFTGELTVFYRPVPTEEEAYTRFISMHQTINASGSLTLQKCLTGRVYEIQMVLSDKEMSSATMVSEAVALKAAAGA